jgi:hypothetical protein
MKDKIQYYRHLCLRKNVTKNINMKNIKQLKVDLAGQVGENAVWDGPLSKEGFPMGKGSSSGCKGMEVSKADCGCDSVKGPITSRARAY